MTKEKRLLSLLESLEREMVGVATCLDQRRELLVGFNWQKSKTKETVK